MAKCPPGVVSTLSNPQMSKKFRFLFVNLSGAFNGYVFATGRGDYCLLKSGTQGASVSATNFNSRSWGWVKSGPASAAVLPLREI
jgi:hypothetical protein